MALYSENMSFAEEFRSLAPYQRPAFTVIRESLAWSICDGSDDDDDPDPGGGEGFGDPNDI